jgi:hypothetical protein
VAAIDRVRSSSVALFVEVGPPLVLKSDDGSAFIAHVTYQEATDWIVLQLFSPPVTPEYNDACEAGNGSMKTLTDHQAARHGRPGQWSCDDLESARSAAPWISVDPAESQPW